jgi:hypothetical protein
VADLVLREADGWEELGKVLDAVKGRHFDVQEFWSALARGAMKAAVGLLEEAGYEFYHPVASVRAYYQPDEIHGELLRIWVKYK